MSHARQQIREATAAQLDTINDFGPNVYTTRIYTYDENALPSANIFIEEDEMIPEANVMGLERHHIVDLMIQIRHKASHDMDDKIDDLCVLVDDVLGGSGDLGGLVFSLELLKTTIEFDPTIDKEVGLATLQYRTQYRINADDNETIL